METSLNTENEINFSMIEKVSDFLSSDKAISKLESKFRYIKTLRKYRNITKMFMFLQKDLQTTISLLQKEKPEMVSFQELEERCEYNFSTRAKSYEKIQSLIFGSVILPEPLLIIICNMPPSTNEYKILKDCLSSGDEYFLAEYEIPKFILCSNYFYFIRNVVSFHASSLKIRNMKLSKEEFEKIFCSAKHCESLEFAECTILTNIECNYGDMSNCKLEKIILKECADIDYSNWIEYPERCLNILSGIKECINLQHNLTSLCFVGLDLNEPIIQTLKSDIENLINSCDISQIDISF